MTVRNPNDLYPTPPCAAFALRPALAVYLGIRLSDRTVVDPAAGYGTLLEWAGVAPIRRWAIDLPGMDPRQARELGRRVMGVQTEVGDALIMDWPRGDVIANPPFGVLERFVRRTLAHLEAGRGQIACILTPVGFWHAQRRADLPAPDWIMALGWRPNFSAGFRVGGAPATSPNQDYCWAIYDTRHVRPPYTRWVRIERPEVPDELVIEHARLARLAVAFAEGAAA